MHLTRCPNFHFYDADRYEACPYCREKGQDPVQNSERIEPVVVRLKTYELFVCKHKVTKLGRVGEKCDLAFPEAETVSACHAAVTVRRNRCYLADCNSSNGTYLNGEKLSRSAEAEITGFAEFGLSRSEDFVIAVGIYAQELKRTLSLCRLSSAETGERRYFFGDTFTLGRMETWKSGAMSDRMIGRYHARIRKVGDACLLEDCSANGTFLNAQRIPEKQPVLLRDGDIICLGREQFLWNQHRLSYTTRR